MTLTELKEKTVVISAVKSFKLVGYTNTHELRDVLKEQINMGYTDEGLLSVVADKFEHPQDYLTDYTVTII